MLYHFIRSSSNAKTGNIPVTMSQKQTCPKACPLKGSGCYAESGNVNIHWSRLSDGRYNENKNVFDVDGLSAQIKALPKGQLWRMNAAGDLAHDNELIDAKALTAIVQANKGKQGFTYTHHNTDSGHNRAYIKAANESGFTINLSANSLTHADTLKALDIGPVVSIVDEWKPGMSKAFKTPSGNDAVICPAITVDGMTCEQCKLCANKERNSIVCFPVHGTSKKKARSIMLKSI